MEESDCFICHQVEKPKVGPSFAQISQRYPNNETLWQLAEKVRKGGSGVWGQRVMNAHPQLKENELDTTLEYILELTTEEDSAEFKP